VTVFKVDYQSSTRGVDRHFILSPLHPDWLWDQPISFYSSYTEGKGTGGLNWPLIYIYS